MMTDFDQSINSEDKVNGDMPLPKLMKPWVAVKLLELCVGGSVTAKDVIADKMRDGELKAYAKTISVSRKKKLKKAWADVPAFDGTMKKIPRNKLIGSAHWAEDVPNWKWRRGRFHIRRKDGGFLLLQGVRFVKNDVLQLIQRYDERIKNLNKGGRGLNESAWYNMWLTVLWMQNNGKLNKATLPPKKTSFPGVVRDHWKNDVFPDLQRKHEGQAGIIITVSREEKLPSVHTMKSSLDKLWADLIA